MREILFRGQSLQGGWVFGYLVRGRWYTNEIPMSVIMPIETHFYPRAEVDGYEEVYTTSVGEYIGIKDKDGTRIFEGDIVEFESHGYIPGTDKGVVFFSNGSWCIKYVAWADYPASHRIGSTSHYQDMGASGTITYTYKVLGNIYDNPELLGSEGWHIISKVSDEDIEEE